MVTRAVSAFIGLISTPLALGYLGKSGFATWSLLQQIGVWISILGFGLPNGLLNVLLGKNAANDRAGARDVVSTIWWLLVGVALFGILMVCVLSKFVYLDVILGVDAVAPPEIARISTLVTLLLGFIGLPLSLGSQVLVASQRMYISNLSGAVIAVLQLIVLLLGIAFGNGFVGIIIWMGAAILIAQGIFCWVAVSGENRDLRPRLRSCSSDAMTRVAILSLPFFLFQLGSLAVNSTQLILLSHVTKSEVVADYSILMRLYVPLIMLVQMVTQAFFPALRDASERGDREWVKNGFRRVLYLRMGFAATCAIAFMCIGNLLLKLWLRNHAVAFDFMVWLALAVLLLSSTWTSVYADLLAIMDRVWPLVILVTVNGAVTIFLTIWWAPKAGLLGSLLAFSAFTLLIGSWVLPYISRDLLSNKSKQDS